MPRLKRKKNKKPNKKIILIFFVLLITASFGATGYLVFLRPGTTNYPAKSTDEYRRTYQPPKLTDHAKITIHDQSSSNQEGISPSPTKPPSITIIIDDMGYHKATGENLLDLNLDLTFAFLPFGPFTKSLSRKARQKGRDILLHLPLEPVDANSDPGPGALYVSMDKQELKTAFTNDLAMVPMAIGLNNHMGSLFTSDREKMSILLTLVAQKKLFFLDSFTTPDSLGLELAEKMGLKTARRDVFLDNDQDEQKIQDQLVTLIELAKKRGYAVGIGHPHPATLGAIKNFQNQLNKNIRLVGVHRLIK